MLVERAPLPEPREPDILSAYEAELDPAQAAGANGPGRRRR
jgi:hypothetical protein